MGKENCDKGEEESTEVMSGRDVRKELQEAKELLRKLKAEMDGGEKALREKRQRAEELQKEEERAEEAERVEWEERQRVEDALVSRWNEESQALKEDARKQCLGQVSEPMLKQTFIGEPYVTDNEFLARANLFWNTHPSFTLDLDDSEGMSEGKHISFNGESDGMKEGIICGGTGGKPPGYTFVQGDYVDFLDGKEKPSTIFTKFVNEWKSNKSEIALFKKDGVKFFEDPKPSIKKLIHHESSKDWGEKIDQVISRLEGAGAEGLMLWGEFGGVCRLNYAHLGYIKELKSAWANYLSEKSSKGLNFNAREFTPGDPMVLSPDVPEGDSAGKMDGCVVVQAYYAGH
jgi:hypothetical protein